MNPQSSARQVRRRRGGSPPWALRTSITAALVAAAIGLAGCTPDPAPKPTPTPLFTSEADAFKAAEQVYRDYTDAGNAAHGGDSEANPEQYLAGAALEDEISVQRQLEEKKLKVVGSIRVVSFAGVGFDSATSRVTAEVCLDVKDARVVDASGTDVTPTVRQEQGLLDLALTRSGDALVIIESKNSDAKC